jgi:hypothetical protein
MGLRTGLDDVEGEIMPIPCLELRPFGCPTLSQSLYLPPNPGSVNFLYTLTNKIIYFRIL